jgi:glycosyltransferase involved in cell wall biosynthesis
MAETELGSPEVTIVANDVGGVGGMERQLTELITGLLGRGTRVTVVSWSCDLPEHANLRWIRVWGPSRPFTIAYPWFIIVASLLVRLRARGVVHSTGAIVLNRTAICTVHYCHRAAAEASSFSRTSRKGPAYRLNAWIAKAMSRLAESWCYRPGRARRLVGVSQGVARELRRHYPRMGERVVVIPNGVDVDAFQPDTTTENGSEDLLAVFVGSEWERKGLGVAIEALHDNPGVRLIVVGEGDVAAYRGLASGLGVAERVDFVGSTADIASWYRRADAFLLPTAYETFSLVTYEAAASGLPLLVTRVNGVEDLLRDGVNGWFVDRDADDVRKRLRALREDPSLRQRMGEAARRDSLEHSWSSVVDAYTRLYAEAARSETNSAT